MRTDVFFFDWVVEYHKNLCLVVSCAGATHLFEHFKEQSGWALIISYR
jgi:hypothetical protein